jgi:thiol-disulfide isomerase/thioredoxin
MKHILLLALAGALLPIGWLTAQETDDANSIWQRILMLSRNQVQSPSGSKDQEIKRLTDLQHMADAFWQRYADDARAWDAKLIALQSRTDLDALKDVKPNLDVLSADVREITSASAAPMGVRAEAAYWLVELYAGIATETKAPDRLTAFDQQAETLAKQFAASPYAARVQVLRMDVYETVDRTKADALLKELAKSGDPRVMIEARRRMMAQELAKKPLDLKFTAVNGAEVDLAKLRGKVVLVDFWATWCGPCRMEMPHVIAAYKKLRDKGFEIVGISLDSDKAKLLDYTKQNGMTWPQYFDGKVWDNKISRDYGIQGIPAMWLLDKKGFVRDTQARADLEGAVNKLLAE